MEFISIDFETANSKRASACQVGWCLVENGEIKERQSHYINPETEFSYYNIKKHGITPEMVKDALTWDELWGEELSSLLENRLIVAHNARFDGGVIHHQCREYDIIHGFNHVSCTYELAKLAWPGKLFYGLGNLCHDFGITFIHHDAGEDAEACAKIFLKAIKEHQIDNFDTLRSKFGRAVGMLDSYGIHMRFNEGGRGSNRTSKRLSDLEYEKGKEQEDHMFYEKKVCFTGELSALTREEAQCRILEIGGKPVTGVRKKTDFVVVGDYNLSQFGEGFISGKLKKAQELNEKGHPIEIIGESEFLKLINEA
jgi:DNA polymerase-3 subunit epsilon